MSDVHCVRCRASIASADVNVQLAIAKCGACGAVFDFTSQVRADAPPIQRRRAQVALPGRWQVEEGPPPSRTGNGAGHGGGGPYRDPGRGRGSLAITWTWQRLIGVVFLLFSVAWWGFLIFWVANAPGAMKLFIAAHAAAGVFILYVGLANLLNRTTVRVEGEVLSVEHGPLWWPGRLQLRVADIDQLFVVQRVSRRSDNRSPGITYHLCSLDRKGTQRKVAELPEADQALYLEQRLEHHLGIIDVEVAGSVTA